MALTETMTAPSRSSEKFSAPLRILHWTLALLLIGLLASGIHIHDIPLDDPGKFALYPWHRAFGVLAFVLVIVRLIARSASNVPEIPATIPWQERTAAKAAQIVLYLAMLSVPVLGYVASSALPEFPNIPPLNSIWFFGQELPLVAVEKNHDTTVFFITIHKYVGYAMIAVIGAHVAGAIKHRYFDTPENDVLAKML